MPDESGKGPPRIAVRTESLGACPICAGNRCRTVLEGEDFDFGSGAYRIEECGSCGSRFTNPRPIEADLTLLYEDRVFEALPTESTILGRIRRHRLLGRVARLWPRFPAGRLRMADVGAGDGFFARALSTHPLCARMLATDLFESPPPTLEPDVRAGLLDYQTTSELLAGSGTYDVVFARFVLEHVRDPVAFVASLGRKLADGGVLVVEVPSWRSVWRRLFGRYYSELSLPAHLFHFDPDNVGCAFPGFRIEARENIHGVVLGPSLLRALGRRSARVGPAAVALLPIEILVDVLSGRPANMTVTASREAASDTFTSSKVVESPPR